MNNTLLDNLAVYIENNTSFVPLRGIAEALGAEVSWLEDKVSVSYEAKSLIIDLNVQKIIADNSADDLQLKMQNNQLWVPLRFFAENLLAEVSYTPKQITINSYSLNQQTKTLNFAGNKIALVDLSVPDWDRRDGACSYTAVVVGVRRLAEDTLLLELSHKLANVVWEPQVFEHKYISYHLIKNGAVLQKTVLYVPFIANEFNPAEIRQFGDNLYLPGDNRLNKIDIAKGEILQEYKLADLLAATPEYAELKNVGLLAYEGSGETFFVDIFEERYLLLRFGDPTANQTSYPVIYDLATNKAVWLHKQIVPAVDMEMYHNKEITESAPNILYKGAKNGELYFDYETINGSISEVIYKLK